MPHLAGLALALLAATASGAPQGYLSDEGPAPRSIDELPSTFDGFGLLRDRREAGRLIPGVLGRFEATENWLQDASLIVQSRSYYRYRDEGDGQIREAFATGGSIDFHSGWLLDTFQIGLTGYTSQKLVGDEDRDGTGLLQDGQGGYSALGQAYLKARYRSATAHLFRQELNYPFLNRNDSRMTPKTFEAYVLTAEDPLGITGLQLGGGHISKIKNRTSSRFVPLSHLAGVTDADRGVTTVGARYELSEDIWLGAIEQVGWDMWNTFYVQAETARAIPGTEFSTRAALQFADQRSTGDQLAGEFESQLFGGTAGLGWRGLVGSVSFSTTADGATVRNPWGGHPSFNSVMISDFDRAGEDAYRLGLSYDFSNIGLEGLSAFANLVHGNAPAGDQGEWNATVDYHRDKGLLRNFWFRVRAGQNRAEGGPTRDEFRVILNYTRTF